MNEQDQRVRDYYENLALPKDRLELMLKAAADSESSRSAQKQVRSVTSTGWRAKLPNMQLHLWLQTGFACALMLVVSLWVFSGADEEFSDRTVREIAMNHTTRLAPEYRGTSLAMLDNSMHQLPFNLRLPKSLSSAYELVGSRYCSLGGILAAHVKLQDKQTGKSMSLFVTSNSAELEEIQPQQKKIEGVEVELWREGGLFFALAQRH